MEYNELLDWLYGLKWTGIKPRIENTATAMEKLGNPQDNLKVIHVTGTNGKGSVCAMLESILRRSGHKAGMFTSPHLVDFRERFQIGRERISEKDVLRLAEKIKETETELTFFEFTTALAFLYFYEKGVDYAIIEVGMGGRYDATNIVKKPIATVITSLSYDHTQWLGASLDNIAYEKAGIAKEGAPMFTPVENETVRKECAEIGAPLVLVKGREETNMRGGFQGTNAAVAAAVARHLKIPEGKIRDGLFSVYWPARLEFIENVLLDCAHNPDGIEKMAEFVKALDYDKLIIVFGVMKDKNYAEMLGLLPKYDTIILTRPKIDRSADPHELKALCSNAIVIEDAAAAYECAKKIAFGGGMILICGSCYLAGELLAHINKIPTHPIMFVQ